jgi:hypothetical protein
MTMAVAGPWPAYAGAALNLTRNSDRVAAPPAAAALRPSLPLSARESEAPESTSSSLPLQPDRGVRVTVTMHAGPGQNAGPCQ